MYMKKTLAFASATLTALVATTLVACGDDSSKASNAEGGSLQIGSAETVDDLPNCTDKKKGEVYKLGDDTYRLCLEKWTPVDYAAETEEDLPSCSENREGQKAYLSEEDDIYTCENEKWTEDKTDSKQESKDKPEAKDDDSSSSKDDSGDNGESVESKDPDSSSSSRSRSNSSTNNKNTEEPEKSSDSSTPETSTSSDPQITKLTLKTLIYDSDEVVNSLFSSDGDHQTSCFGINSGIVKESLGSDKKPEFNAGNSNATTCMVSANNFNTLFNYAVGMNEISRYDLQMSLDEDGMYTFGPDNFFPIDSKTDDDILTDLSPNTCNFCRTLRKAEAMPPWKGENGIDYQYCNSQGWFGGVDCDGLFTDGTTPEVWDWLSRESWKDVTHNQQFCMEMNGSFTYKADQVAKFFAGGDLWVFVNGKLALDQGGLHMPTPGYIAMKNLNTTYGSDFLKESTDYPIDVFFCSRRTTISAFGISTNFVISQK